MAEPGDTEPTGEPVSHPGAGSGFSPTSGAPPRGCSSIEPRLGLESGFTRPVRRIEAEGPLVLAIETSCDDTCAAVLRGRSVLSSVVSSQHELHAEFGGIVPEVASRRHLELIDAVIEAALLEAGCEARELGQLAVTRGPGLVGALLVGLAAAKAWAAALRLPLVGVDHLRGHLASAYLEPDPIEPPFLCLIASGGHTLLVAVERDREPTVLGQTLDDAAGEALDKGARLLGLGFPGGPAIERAAVAGGDPRAFDFPVSRLSPGSLDFSFSGVKTSLAYRVRDARVRGARDDAPPAPRIADLAASYEAAVIAQLCARVELALTQHPAPTLALAGGVAANRSLRERCAQICDRRGVRLKLVAPALCTDNAAMIAAAAAEIEPTPYPDYLGWDALGDSTLGG